MLQTTTRRRVTADPFAGLKRRWELEEVEAQHAKAVNAYLQATARTKFKAGDTVLLNGRTPVRILEVFPQGYISAPAKHNVHGRMGPPVVCDRTSYHYRRLDAVEGISGQTTEDELQSCPS